MKNLFKFGFFALAISLSVAACNSNKSADGADSAAMDSMATDSVMVDTMATDTMSADTAAMATDTTAKM